MSQKKVNATTSAPSEKPAVAPAKLVTAAEHYQIKASITTATGVFQHGCVIGDQVYYDFECHLPTLRDQMLVVGKGYITGMALSTALWVKSITRIGDVVVADAVLGDALTEESDAAPRVTFEAILDALHADDADAIIAAHEEITKKRVAIKAS